MKIAFSGSHRTGKSTIAQAAANEFGWKFVNTKPATSSAIDFQTLEQMKGQIALTNRLRVQENMMVGMGELYVNGKGNRFYDRGMLDVLAYTMVHVQKITKDYQTDGLEDKRIGKLLKNLIDRLVLADFTFITTPNIPWVDAPNKGSLETQLDVHDAVLWAAEKYLKPNRYFILPEWADTVESKLAVIQDVLKVKKVLK